MIWKRSKNTVIYYDGVGTWVISGRADWPSWSFWMIPGIEWD